MSDALRILSLRDSIDADVPTITELYAHWVANSLSSFELEPPTSEEMAKRRAALLAGGYPFFVVEDKGGKILGYAYTGPYRTRSAYRFACEDSIYVAHDAMGLGVGRLLMEALIAHSEKAGFRLMVAVIGDSGNAPSIGLHKAFGFTHAGMLPSIGWKHGRWVDSVLMVRELGAGASSPP